VPISLNALALASAEVAATSSRTAKTDRLASVLRGASPDEVRVAVAYLSGVLPHEPIGVGWASIREVPPPAPEPTLRVLEVDEAFRRIGAMSGGGSQAARREALAALFARATEDEQRFLRGLLTGEIRQGALEGVMADAVARAADVPLASVRRALMLTGDLGAVAAAALAEGETGLARFRLEVGTPLKPMLAQSAEDLADAFARVSPASLEWKLDGARLQVHRDAERVWAFTRNLADVTDRVPEIVERILALDVRTIVLDGEAIALKDGGHPHPFQVSMARFARRLNPEQLRAQVPLSYFAFDVLHVDGDDVLDHPQSERSAILDDRLPMDLRVPRIVAFDTEHAEAFFEDALERGHEGVMVKSLDAPYEAGRRGAGWIKVKRAKTLDLVVLAAEWGHGRRRGWLSNLHLGARDPSSGAFVMLGKTFKGMTDEVLRWQTERLLELETRREGITVFVRPELVVEVAFDGLQTSTRYPGGLALRFARIKGYRPDKRPEDADTIETVRALA
jgi:ATP-dependent DNA ligase I